MSDQGSKVHFDRDGRPRCGNTKPFALTADREAVTCVFCLNLLAGTSHVGVYHADTRPHGTTAAYRRHQRHGQEPCEACKQAKARWREDSGYGQRDNERRRAQYAAARAAGATAAEANRYRDRSAA